MVPGTLNQQFMTMIAIQTGFKWLSPNSGYIPCTISGGKIHLTRSCLDTPKGLVLSTQEFVKELSKKLAQLNPDHTDLNLTILLTSLALLEESLSDYSKEEGQFTTTQVDVESVPVSFLAESLLFSKQQKWLFLSQPVFTQLELLLLHGALHHAELCLMGDCAVVTLP